MPSRRGGKAGIQDGEIVLETALPIHEAGLFDALDLGKMIRPVAPHDPDGASESLQVEAEILAEHLLFLHVFKEFMQAFDAIGIHYPCTAASEIGQGNALLAAGTALEVTLLCQRRGWTKQMAGVERRLKCSRCSSRDIRIGPAFGP